MFQGRTSFLFSFFIKIAVLTSAHSTVMAAKNIPSVKSKKISFVEASETFLYPAKIESRIQSVVLAETEGIAKLKSNIGASVKKGQILMIVQNLDPVYQYAPVRIIAPFTGVISEIFINEGSQVIRGQKLLSILDPSQIRVTVEIPSSDLSRIGKGVEAAFKTSMREETSTKLKIEGISPLVNSTTNTATAILTFKQKTDLKPGTLGQVEFKIASEKQILVGEGAVIYKNSQAFIRVIEGDIAKYRQVTLGARQNGQIAVVSGLKEGEVIVDKASQYIPDNKKVKIEN